MKLCTKCKTNKEHEEFYSCKVAKDSLQSWCRTCFIASVRDSYLRRTYGVTQVEYSEMLAAQNGGCAICDKTEDTVLSYSGKPKALAVDYDASTGVIRGILCENCNRGIGLLSHNSETLRRAAEYLDQF